MCYNKNKKLKGGGKMKFEDLATEKGIRLIAKNEKVFVEIGLHFTAPDGDFYVDIQEEGRRFILLPDFQSVIDFITKHYGENNLEEYKEKARKLHIEMYENKYVRKWKRGGR
jgi:hypothetical protein